MSSTLTNKPGNLYKQNYARIKYYILLLSIILVTLGVVGIKFGAVNFSFKQLISLNEFEWQILWQLRLPRIIVGGLVGISLGIAGVIIQGLMRNPLADPGLIGITSGASLFAMIFIVISEQLVLNDTLQTWGIVICAFFGSFIATTVTYILSTTVGFNAPAILLLSGIAINSLCGALIGVLTYISNDNMLRSMTFWNMGSLSQSNYSAVIFIGSGLLITGFLFKSTIRLLNALLIGDGYAKQLGINLTKEKSKAIILIALIVGISTAFIGPISFIALVVPHIMRFIVGNNQGLLLISSGLCGAIMVIGADILARSILAPAEIPLGIITALIGTPYFIYLLTRYKQSGVKNA